MFVHMFTTSNWPIWDDLNIWTSPEVSHLYVRKTPGLMSSLHQRWLKHDDFTVGDLDLDTPTPSTPRSSEKTSRSESGRPWFVVGIKKTNILPVRHEYLTFGTLCQVQERNFTGSRILRMFGQFVKSLWTWRKLPNPQQTTQFPNIIYSFYSHVMSFGYGSKPWCPNGIQSHG